MNTSDINALKALTPTGEDQEKIHAEVNQLSAHVINSTLSAVALFGGICAAMVLKDFPQSQKIPNVISVASLILLLVLWVLYYLTYTYFRSLRFLTTYLRLTKASVWEQHYFQYCIERGRPFFLYSEARAILFAVLGVITCALPWIISVSVRKGFECTVLAWILVPACVLYIAIVLFLGFSKEIHLGLSQSLSWERFFEDVSAGPDA